MWKYLVKLYIRGFHIVHSGYTVVEFIGLIVLKLLEILYCKSFERTK